MATSRSPPRGTSQSPALFRAAEAGRARVHAVFGGQGNTEDYFSELRGVWDAHPHLIEDLLARGSETLKSLVQNVEGSQNDLYSKGLDIKAWLQDPDSTPASEYMLTAPISVPLIGLTQLLQFAAVCKRLEFTPGEFWQRSAGITGHSQGIVVAAAIATAHSWESFIDAAVSALRILFWIGYRTQLAFPREAVLPSIVADSIKHGEGPPTPMMAISDLSQAQVERAIDEINVHLAEDKRLFVSLVNGSRNIVVSGPPMSLHGLAVRLRSKNVPGSQDQSRTPFSKRKESFQLRYLPITVPFHSSYLLGASFAIEEDLRDIKLEPKALKIPVYDTKTGMDLRRSTADDLVPELVRMITLDRVDWPRAISFPHATHIIDFGPGGVSGAGMLAHKIKEGTGVRVLIAGATDGLSNDLGYQSEILSRDEDVKFGVNWSEKFKPRLVKTAAGVTYIDTKMSRLLGLPPIMVAGMTPSTVPWDFVAATMNANYHIELAGGGYYNPKTMTAALVKIQDAVQPGRGICVNLIFANPAAMQWQIPMIRDLQMGGTGASIAGMTIGAGVPSPEIVNGYIETLGLRYIGFKPGSVGTIQRVIDIARAHPDFPIMLQWTGGRGGGHHSYEDFHQPILQTYGAIRKCDNIILVAGSGFGGSEDTYPYLNGSWSEVLGYPTMPFDGCLFGSRVMTAKEAHTSKAAKQAIVNAKGVADAEWEKTYEGPAGGIITVRSEMGEPLHTLATRGMIFWSEMDKTIFSLERAKRVAALTKRREYIIRNLNANFQKPWFGNVGGEAADLQDMTYGQIVRRMVQLLFVKHQARWIDQSYKRLVGDFLRRVEERLARSANQLSLLACYSDLDEEPEETINIILKAYPGAEEQLINGEDAQYFLQLCQRPGQKPVPFIPVLDENFETWFKKDSLWQSEDLDAVVDQDVGRTSILQGPVAVKYSTVIDEPIKDILDGINTDHIRFLTEELYNGDSDVIPISDYFFGNDVRELPSNDQYTATEQNDGAVIYALPLVSALPLPSPKAWLQLLAGSSRSSRYALFMSDKIIQDVCQQNPYRRIFTPRRGIRGMYILIAVRPTSF